MGNIIVTTLALLLLLGGCAHTLGYGGKNPGAIECDGEASISLQGSGAIAIGYGGTELNGASVQFKCNKGVIRQYNPTTPLPAPK